MYIIVCELISVIKRILLIFYKISTILLGVEPTSYQQKVKDSWLNTELKSVRNIRPSFNTSLGILGGIMYTGGVYMLTRGKEPWTFKNKRKFIFS